MVRSQAQTICRAFYNLERLWGNAERHEIDAAPA